METAEPGFEGDGHHGVVLWLRVFSWAFPRGHWSWESTSLLGQGGINLAQIWPLPALLAHSVLLTLSWDVSRLELAKRHALAPWDRLSLIIPL